ncbi:hypothetical protein [Geoalkalibacter sp.]|uniref:hypothetical protein n=1 Tax=Geoalkalibacter sp. TaxID=3041440 RepID=UPI00272DD577|nr:hypothetical protein [Geoalkalibacter sp.]
MRLSEWLNQQVADQVDVSHIDPPSDILFDDQPDETIFFEEINPCGILCRENHPFATVERYDRWYFSRGQDKKVGIHSSEGNWSLITRDKELALRTARAHLE